MVPELWSSLPETISTVVKVLLIYVGAVAALRIAGRRTLAQLSAFDIVVTIAIGSTIASAVVPSDAAVSDALVVLVTLLCSQVVIAAARQRFPRTRKVLDFAPLAVFQDGKLELRRTPTSAQLTPEEVYAMLRQKRVFDLGDVRLVVLEPTGNISVSRSAPPVESEVTGPVKDV